MINYNLYVVACLLCFLKSTSAASIPDDNGKVIDVAVIGGGASGSYAAYRLATASSTSKLHTVLFESTDRIGGRLFSPLLSKDHCGSKNTNARGELGGMRIRQGEHHDILVNNIVKQLNIEVGLFAMNSYDTSARDDLNNIRRLRGFNYPNYCLNNFTANGTNGEDFPYVFLEDQIQVTVPGANASNARGSAGHPFWLDEMSIDKDDDALVTVHPDLNRGTSDICNGKKNRKLLVQPFGGEGKAGNQPLYTYSYKTGSLQGLGESNEQFQMSSDVSGYHSGASTNYIGEGAINLATKSNVTGYHRPLKGMQDIPLTLVKAFKKAAKKKRGKGDDDEVEDDGDNLVRMNHKLIKIERNKDKSIDAKYKLTFQKTKTSICSGKTVGTKKKVYVFANRAILAMPQVPLRKIAIDTKITSQDAWKQKVDSVNGVSALKLFLGWKKPWWKKSFPDFKAGRTITSSPLHQVYSWYPGTQSLENTCKDDDYSVLQIYVDGNDDFYWKAYLMDEINPEACPVDTPADQCGKKGCFPSDLFVGDPLNRYPKTLNMEVKKHLSVLFDTPVEKISDPDSVHYHLWDKFNPVTEQSAWHNWRPGQKFWEDYQTMLTPFGAEEAIHVVGEAYSMNHGWTEGALQTAEALLYEVLGIESVAGLTKEDHCYSNPYWVDE